MARIAFDCFDEVGNQVIPPFERYVNGTPCAFDLIAAPNQSIVNGDDVKTQYNNEPKQNE
jgi:hypothetical protein